MEHRAEIAVEVGRGPVVVELVGQFDPPGGAVECDIEVVHPSAERHVLAPVAATFRLPVVGRCEVVGVTLRHGHQRPVGRYRQGAAPGDRQADVGEQASCRAVDEAVGKLVRPEPPYRAVAGQLGEILDQVGTDHERRVAGLPRLGAPRQRTDQQRALPVRGPSTGALPQLRVGLAQLPQTEPHGSVDGRGPVRCPVVALGPLVVARGAQRDGLHHHHQRDQGARAAGQQVTSEQPVPVGTRQVHRTARPVEQHDHVLAPRRVQRLAQDEQPLATLDAEASEPVPDRLRAAARRGPQIQIRVAPGQFAVRQQSPALPVRQTGRPAAGLPTLVQSHRCAPCLALRRRTRVARATDGGAGDGQRYGAGPSAWPSARSCPDHERWRSAGRYRGGSRALVSRPAGERSARPG